MKRAIAVFLTLSLLTASFARAAVVLSGDCYPSSSGEWNSDVNGDVGIFDSSTGSVTIDDGSSLACKQGNLGMAASSIGTVTVSGTGSIFSTAVGINFGLQSNSLGELHIEAGGTVNTGTQARLGRVKGSTGLAVITGSGSTWNVNDSCVVGWSGDGTVEVLDGGTINTKASGFIAIGYAADSVGTALISGTDSLWDAGTQTFKIGAIAGSEGYVTIADSGTLLSGTSYIGNNGSGEVTVSNNGVWNNSGELIVGYSGHGILNIEAGGIVNATMGRLGRNSGSTGEVTVSGTGAQWNNTGNMVVGWSRDSSMTITDEGVVNNTQAWLGYMANTNGEVTVSNGGVWNNSGELAVGNNGHGILNIEAGGIVNATIGRLGRNSGSTGDVTVSGTVAQWNNTGNMMIGKSGNGSMTIADGGTVTNTAAWIGYSDGVVGEVTVSDANSAWNINDYFIIAQNGGTGTLTIENNAEVTVATKTCVSQPGSSGTLNLNSGTLNTNTLYANYDNLNGTGDIHTNGLITNTDLVFDVTNGLVQDLTGIGTDSGITVHLDADGTGEMGAGYDGAGSLAVSEGAVLQSTSGVLADYSSATATASVSGAGSAWNNTDGNLIVGRDGAATLSITDKGLVSARGLIIDNDIANEVEGAIADSFITMATGGMLALFIDLDEDGIGDDLTTNFDISDLTSIIQGSSESLQWWNEELAGGTGDWDSLGTATLGTDYTIGYLTEGDLAEYTLLTVGGVEARIPGDANNDGKVNGSDVTILAGNWQAGVNPGDDAATWEMGDFNNDGKVDGSDVTILAGNWQKGVTVSASAVPEPSTLVLLLLGMVALPFVRRLGCN